MILSKCERFIILHQIKALLYLVDSWVILLIKLDNLNEAEIA
jgi:hypothetical protein